MAYGVDSSRFAENKRAVADKYIGVMVRTSMNRCILCTRCVPLHHRGRRHRRRGRDRPRRGYGDHDLPRDRDALRIAGQHRRPLPRRCAAAQALRLQGAALGADQDAVDRRPWTRWGSSIRIDTRMREVMRILPRVNDAVNEEWISDKTRQVVDGLKAKRLDRPFIRRGGKLTPATWQEAFARHRRQVKTAAPAGSARWPAISARSRTCSRCNSSWL